MTSALSVFEAAIQINIINASDKIMF